MINLLDALKKQKPEKIDDLSVYTFNYGFVLAKKASAKKVGPGFIFKKKTAFKLSSDSRIDYGFQGTYDKTSNFGEHVLDIKTGRNINSSLLNWESDWLKFSNVAFESTSTDVISIHISANSAVFFENCQFKGVKVDCLGLVRCSGCTFTDGNEYLLKSARPCLLKSCNFENSQNGVLLSFKQKEDLETIIEDCNFLSMAQTGLGLTLGDPAEEETMDSPETASDLQIRIQTCNFTQCQTAVFAYKVTLFMERLMIVTSKPTPKGKKPVATTAPMNTGIILNNCKAHISRTNVQGALVGMEIVGNTSETGLFQCKYQKCNVGAVFAAKKLERQVVEGEEGITRRAWLAGCVFVQNGVGLRLENFRCEVLGSTFVFSDLHSIELVYPGVDDEIFRSFNQPGQTDSPLRFNANNFIEFKPKTKFFDKPELYKKFRISDERVFQIKGSYEVPLYMDNLVERLRSGYLHVFFYSQNSAEALVWLNSVRALLFLVKEVKNRLLAFQHLKSELRLCYFLATYPIDYKKNGTKREATLFEIGDVLKAWTDFAYMEKYDEAIEILTDAHRLKRIDQKIAAAKIQELSDERVQTFLYKKFSRQRTYLLDHLIGTRPLSALTLIAKASIQPEYKKISEKNGGNYKALEVQALLMLATSRNDEENEEVLNVRWTQVAAAQMLLERMTSDLQSHFNLFDSTNPVLIGFLPIGSNVMLSQGRHRDVVKLLQYYQRSGVLHDSTLAAILEEANLKGKKWHQDNLSVAIEEATKDYEPGAPTPLLFHRVMTASYSKTIEDALSHVRSGIFDESLRNELTFGAVYGYITNKHSAFSLELNLESGNCGICGVYVQAHEIIVPCSNSSHKFCPTCFTENFTGYCPGGCGQLVSKANMCKADVPPEKVIKFQRSIFQTALRNHIASLKTKWYQCAMESCEGGSSKVDSDNVFTCCVCGMFGFTSDTMQLTGSMSGLWSDKTLMSIMLFLYKEAAVSSNFLGHYFPYTMPTKVFFNGKKEDENKLQRTMAKFPDTENGFKTIKDPLVFMLIRWVLQSNPTSIRLVKKKQYPKFLPKLTSANSSFTLSDPKVHLLQVQSTQEKELTFQKLKKKYGSFWAFHGSNLRNWHSIIRTGLRNYSNTKMMTAGAAYGAGIYLSPDINIPLGYSGGYNNKLALAVIEVANNRKMLTISGNIYVAKAEDQVQVRYVIVKKDK
eukprot:augustus_masked-scaffold_72-processed-gene-0.3-mRNA-1 protein AED:1.00 eAED:1.00 QI:0/-1/0/0/-1/1/1/0/1193